MGNTKGTKHYRRSVVCPYCGSVYQTVSAKHCGRTDCTVKHKRSKALANKMKQLGLPFTWENTSDANTN